MAITHSVAMSSEVLGKGSGGENIPTHETHTNGHFLVPFLNCSFNSRPPQAMSQTFEISAITKVFCHILLLAIFKNYKSKTTLSK